MELGERDGAAPAVGPPPGAVAGPGEERLDVGGALQLVQPVDLGMLGGQPVEEHPHRLDPGVRAGGAQHGADGLGVADHLPADVGLGDEAGELDGRASRLGHPAPGRAGGQAELEADLGERRTAGCEPWSGPMPTGALPARPRRGSPPGPRHPAHPGPCPPTCTPPAARGGPPGGSSWRSIRAPAPPRWPGRCRRDAGGPTPPRDPLRPAWPAAARRPGAGAPPPRPTPRTARPSLDEARPPGPGSDEPATPRGRGGDRGSGAPSGAGRTGCSLRCPGRRRGRSRSAGGRRGSGGRRRGRSWCRSSSPGVLGGERLRRQVDVGSCGLRVGVAHQLLQHQQVDPGLGELGAVGVAQPVGPHPGRP